MAVICFIRLLILLSIPVNIRHCSYFSAALRCTLIRKDRKLSPNFHVRNSNFSPGLNPIELGGDADLSVKDGHSSELSEVTGE